MFTQNKKQINKRIRQLFSSILIAGVLVIVIARPGVIAQTADQLQQQKNAIQQKLDAINKQISDYQNQIDANQKQANTLANQIKTINLQIVQTQAQIEATNAKIDATNLEIADVTNKIVTAQNDIAKQKEILRSLISDINDLDQRSPLEIALENDNFQQFIDQLQYDTSIQEQSQDALTKIKQLQADLVIRQADLKTEKSNLDNLSTQLSIQNSSLSGQRSAKQQILNQTKGQEAAYKRLLNSSQQEANDINDEINKLDSQIAAKLGNNKLAPHKGLLAYPMQGVLTQGYGNTGFTSLGYSFHNGIDIAAAAGTPIYAAGNGTVVATGNTTASGEDGAYGNWVAIKHDTGKFAAHPIITLYGHMASFVMHTGQIVAEGDLVGFEGNTGNTTRILYGPHRGYHLHFTVFDAQGFGVAAGAHQASYGAYQVPYGAPYNPLDFL